MFTKHAAASASFPLVVLSVGARAMQMVVCRAVAWHVRRPLVCRVGRHARRAETERAGVRAFAPRGYCHGARPRSRLFTVLFVFLFVSVCVRSCHSCPRVLIIARHDLVATPQALQDVLLRAAAPRFYFGRPRSGWVGV